MHDYVHWHCSIDYCVKSSRWRNLIRKLLFSHWNDFCLIPLGKWLSWKRATSRWKKKSNFLGGVGRTRLSKSKFLAKFPIGLHMNLQIGGLQILKKNQNCLKSYYFKQKSVGVQPWTLEVILNGFCLWLLHEVGAKSVTLGHSSKMLIWILFW